MAAQRAVVDARIREVLASTYFVLNENGPLCFTVGGSDPADLAHRVSVGDRHTCSCAVGRAGREPCEHMLFVLLKVFRIPPTNPLLYGLGIREAQLEEVMKGRAKRTSRARYARAPSVGALDAGAGSLSGPTGAEGAPSTVVRRPPGPDDSCPICMETLDSGGSLVWCREGCGNNVHRHCMLVWQRHRSGPHGTKDCTCPMCRAPWGEIGLPEREERGPRVTAARRRDQRMRELADADAATHYGITCAGCKGGAIVGTRFRCIICDGFNLCTLCFANPTAHAQHTFECVRRSGQEWEVADREALVDAVRERMAAGSGMSDGAEGSRFAFALDYSGEALSAEAQLAKLARVQMPRAATGAVPADEPPPAVAERGAGDAGPSRTPPGLPGASRTPPGFSADPSAQPEEAPEPARAVAHCAHCGRVARKQQWFKAFLCGHYVHEACLPDWLRVHHGQCPTCAEQVVSPTALVMHNTTGGGAPTTLGRAGSATANGRGVGSSASVAASLSGPVAGRRRTSAPAGKQRGPTGAGSPDGGFGLRLGVTGCSCPGACGQPAPTAMGLAGRTVGPCAAPVTIGMGGSTSSAMGRMLQPRQSGVMRGRLVRGPVTLAVTGRCGQAHAYVPT
ncbi:hypothetical protein T492DRAFT_938458 [Pavlovales sp. CCMP2436]|nr:hypothetical protein T492DRAFT_938458 [Pavlovales sp. CCMP2436]